jgi:hypothetical protein
MRPHWFLLLGCLLPAACAVPHGPGGVRAAQDEHVPPFATAPYEPFSTQAVVAIALREWRLFGQPVDDDPPGTRPPPLPEDKPEREQGLWQRVGEYWWIGLDPGSPESGWTGKHDASGVVFPASVDASYAWSAAFISYVMRIAGAGTHFPYAADHADYIDAAVRMTGNASTNWVINARRPEDYAPQPGDLICSGRGPAAKLRYDDLPVEHFPAHCGVVVDAAVPGQISIIGGNVDDAVTLTHVPVTPDGKLATPDGVVLDTRYPWMIVLQDIPIPPQPVS